MVCFWRAGSEGLWMKKVSQKERLLVTTCSEPHIRTSGHVESVKTCRLKKIYGTNTKGGFKTAIVSIISETEQNLENHWVKKSC